MCTVTDKPLNLRREMWCQVGKFITTVNNNSRVLYIYKGFKKNCIHYLI